MTAEPHLLRRIVICADDYGLAPGVNAAIRDLLSAQRINATSVMVLPRAFDAAAANALTKLKAANPAIQIGLHVTLTAPFRPLTGTFRPLRDGGFYPVQDTLTLASRRQFGRAGLAAEVAAQIGKFVAAFGQPPDFIDGHQHVQLFPQIRDAVLHVAAEYAPSAWLRQCGRAGPLHRRLADRKGLLLDVLSVRFRSKAARLGLRTNPAFAGTYAFRADADFAALFPRFLDRLPDGGLVMCHPGFVDGELLKLDPLTHLREREHAYFMTEQFRQTLERHNAALA